MPTVVLGITYGGLIGVLGNAILFRVMEERRRAGHEPIKGIGGVFFLRYILDAVSLILFWFLTHDRYGLIAAALSITVAVKISLFIVYRRKGGRL